MENKKTKKEERKMRNAMLKMTVAGVLVLGMLASSLSAKADETRVGVAVLDFETKDKSIVDLGDKIADMLSVRLTTNPLLQIVERKKLDKILKEMTLGISGIVKESEAAKIGHLTGAKVLITGRAFPMDNQLVIVAKIIGTERSRVFAAMSKGPLSGKLETIIDELSEKVNNRITASMDDLLARTEVEEDPIAALLNKIKGKRLPSVAVVINEIHVNTSWMIDPAAEIEILYFLKQCGFDIVNVKNTGLSDWAREYFKDAKTEFPKNANVDVVIIGEAFSEFGARIGNLVSCKGRLEIRAIDVKTNKILAIDRKVKAAVDLSERIAAKKALQKTAAEVSLRFIPQVVDSWDKANRNN